MLRPNALVGLAGTHAGSGSGSVVEHLLAKEGVEGSNPFFRSNFSNLRCRLSAPFLFAIPSAAGVFLARRSAFESHGAPDDCDDGKPPAQATVRASVIS